MYPVLLQIGNFQLRTYGLMAALGFLCGCVLVNFFRKEAKMSADQASGTLFLAILSGVIGARIFYVVQSFDYYCKFPGKIIRIDQGGLVFYGGFLLAIATLYFYCRKQKLDFIRVLDVYTPAMAAAHAFGRIGCFFNGCCFGGVANVPWGVHYPAGSAPALAYPGAALHPTQLYEAGEQILLIGLYIYLLRKAPRGVACAAYLTIYGILRFGNEFYRGDNPKLLQLFTQAQWIGLALVPVGILLLIGFIRHARKNA